MAKLDELGVKTMGQWIVNNFARLTHSHVASDITSGTLSVACGGTGTSNADLAMANLKGTKGIYFKNITLSGSWTLEEEPEYDNYPYHYDITASDFSEQTDKDKINSVTSSYFPQVVFSVDDAVSGYFAPVSDALNGGVRIYSTSVPESSTTILTLVCTIYY